MIAPDASFVLTTERLALRLLTFDDAAFLVGLLNEPSFLRFIGDRGVRKEADARRYLTDGPLASYARHGFGLYLVELKQGATPIGLCGLLQRETLPDVDLGFAFLPEYWSAGYAIESARAVMTHGRSDLGLARIVAITSPDNSPSQSLLKKLGFQFESVTRLGADTGEVHLYASGV